MPPAVDPGEPPISIQRIISAWPDPLIRVRSTVLNPAVRRVTDWNSAGKIRSAGGRSGISKKKNHRAGSRIRRDEARITVLLCSR